MSAHQPIREGFWQRSLQASARHAGAANGTVVTLPISAERDAERLERLDETDFLAIQRISGLADSMDMAYLQEGLDVGATVGCVRVADRLGREVGAATGVMVSPRLLLTPFHVLPSAEVAALSTVWFRYERDEAGIAKTASIFRLEPQGFFYGNEDLDFTLVAVEEIGNDGTSLSEFGSVVLVSETPKAGSKEKLNVVEHPSGGFKQLHLRSVQLRTLFDEHAHFTSSRAVTSGAVVFNDQWEFAALLHAGVAPLTEGNDLVGTDGTPVGRGGDEDSVAWVACEGIRGSRICDVLYNTLWKDDEQEYIDELLDTGFEEFEEEFDYEDAEEENAEPTPAGEGTHETEEVSVEPPSDAPIPMEVVAPWSQPASSSEEQITQTPPPLPPMEVVNPAEPPALPTESVQAGVEPPDLTNSPESTAAEVQAAVAPISEPKVEAPEMAHYANLSGFDESFLGSRTPLPRMLPALKQQVAKSKQGVEVLDYTHFSVVMNGRRRLAFFAAFNVDGQALVSPASTADWWVDPRLDDLAQVTSQAYAERMKPMLWARPELVSWGSGAEKAAADTRHFTNSTPSLEAADTEVWSGIESALLHSAAHRKISVYAGPVVQASDMVFKGVNVPTAFWKVVVFSRSDGSLVAAGFYHALQASSQTYETRQVRLSEIEMRSGLDFGSLKSSDVLSAQAEGRELRSLEDINL